MHKVWFYIALLSLLIGGTYFSLPSDEEREKMRLAAQKRKAELQAKRQQKLPENPKANTILPKSASAP